MNYRTPAGEIIDTFRCPAANLLNLTGGSPYWLRLDGDTDDPKTWHQVKTTKDPFGDIDGVVTLVFHDGTPEKMFNETDEVEFATIRPPWLADQE
jgi:hypothetical protein